jgi:hypothetical protein
LDIVPLFVSSQQKILYPFVLSVCPELTVRDARYTSRVIVYTFPLRVAHEGVFVPSNVKLPSLLSP